jgi:predicted transcriptional regulator
MSIKEFLNELSIKRAPGPTPSFNVLDLIRFLKLLAEAGSLGRGKISRMLELGEGTIRTILSRLSEAGLITTSRKGCSLTQKGKALWSALKGVMPEIIELEEVDLMLAPKNVAVLVRGYAEKVRNGIEQRDAAISRGAKGAVTMICKDSRIIIPGVNMDLERGYPATFRKIMFLMKPKDGDVIIVSGASTRKEAEYGALAAAWLTIS